MTVQRLKQALDIFAEADPTADVCAEHDEIFVCAMGIDPTSEFGQQLLALDWRAGENMDYGDGWAHYV